VADIADGQALADTFSRYEVDMVAHFAASAYVGESLTDPDLYYRNNSVGSLSLLETMRRCGLRRIIFSSTCATYGHPAGGPIDESHAQWPINPYGWSKLMVERMLVDFGRAFGLSSVALRYFNAAGCDPDGAIGERHEPETHVIPVAIAAALEGGEFIVNGSDFDTRDGTAVRDYVHVADLADAHVRAADLLMRQEGTHVFNLGTGVGTTVNEILAAVRAETGAELKAVYGPRREGDPAMLVAAGDKARRELGWTPTRSDIGFIVSTAARWARRMTQAAA